jgi:polyisoprenoid-binding protein YceI
MTPQSASSRRGPIIAVVAVIVLVVAIGGAWYLFLRPSGPAPVSLGSAAPRTAQPSAAADPAADPDGAAATAGPSAGVTAGPSAGASASAPGSSQDTSAAGAISGTWNVDPTVGSFEDFSGSFVGYRVKETLASIGATEAVGRTPDVTGSITVDGSTITAAEFSADLTGLRSDNDRRDGQLRRQALETDQFPTATFKLTAPVDLGAVPAEGATADVTASGDLTLHGVTKPVEIPLQARLQDGVVTVAGALPIAFADYAIAKPEAMIVLSVEDAGTLEVQLQLTKG